MEESEFAKVRYIAELLDEKPMIRPSLLELARWMSDYYCCPLETAVRSVLPVAVRDGKVGAKKQNTVRAARVFTEEDFEAIARRAPRQADALRVVTEGPILVTEAANKAGVHESVFRTLEKNGLVVIEVSVVSRNPYSERFVAAAELTLNA
ncbi:MAG: primosomal protein N', partial [Spartobacteria bacterium]